jgi:hypothetical protein
VRPAGPARPQKPAPPAPLPFRAPPRPDPPRAKAPAAAREPVPLPTRQYVSPWAPRPATPPTPPPGGVERRRKGGKATRALGSPLPALSPERARQIGRWTLRAALVMVGIVTLAGLGLGARALWEMRQPVLLARHRPEALCFRLAESPAFAPPMSIEPSVAVLRGRFSARTPAGYAIREAMGLTDPLVIGEKKRTVGDFEVTTLWARVPGQDGFWLVLGWMEGSDLASLSFHFPSEDGALSREIVSWGDRLMGRVLVPANFRASAPPSASWRQVGTATLPTFGPQAVRARVARS